MFLYLFMFLTLPTLKRPKHPTRGEKVIKPGTEAFLSPSTTVVITCDGAQVCSFPVPSESLWVSGDETMVIFRFVCLLKIAWFGHVTRHDSLSKTILQDTLEGGRRRGRQRKCWMDNIKMWTSPAHARTAHNGLLQNRLEEDLC